MSDPTPQERARALFEAGTLPCDCAAPDNGVGIQHESYCASNGYPKPDNIAAAIVAAEKAAMAKIRAKICPTCQGEALLCRACGKSRRDYEHISTVHGHGPCRGAETKICQSCDGAGAVMTQLPALPDDTLKWKTSRIALERLYHVSSQVHHANVSGVLSLAELGISANELRDALTSAIHVLGLEP